LSPFDRLVADRKRMDELFGFDYILEMYKPSGARIWGYYALPILYGDRLVGKLDATAEREAGVLRVDAIHEDEPFGTAVSSAVDREIDDLASWLHLERTTPR
ncbi:MAG: DNA glycosylase AlkZ-like family protein, partial [Nocardioides sp.]